MQDVTGGAGFAPLGGWASQLAELVRAAGSERKAAIVTGHSRSTFWRWKTGRATPKPATLQKLATAVRAARVSPGCPTDKGIVLEVTEWRSGRRDGTSRALSGDRLGVRSGTMARVVDAYVATGDPEMMGRAFVAGVTVGFYRNALAAGLDPQGPSGPVDTPDGDDEGDEDSEEAVYDLYEDYDDDLRGEEIEDGGSYGFDVA